MKPFESKPRRSYGAIVFAASLSFGVLLPGVLTAEAGLPAAKNQKAQPVSPEDAQKYFEQKEPRGPDSPKEPSATAITPEIQEMARALKNDPDLIYQYVYDRIEYIPIYTPSTRVRCPFQN